MAIHERETLTSSEPSELSLARPIEVITMPDGTVHPAHPLVLRGLAESISNGMPLKQAAEMYKIWDPKLPETDIYRHLNS
jgi:hypothetical protein